MRYIPINQVLLLHERIVTQTGGSAGLRHTGLLEAALGRPQATFGSEDLYPSLMEKTAALFDSLIRNHPFIDGNKRIAISVAGLLLERNGRRLTASNGELETFALQAAQSAYTLEKSLIGLTLIPATIIRNPTPPSRTPTAAAATRACATSPTPLPAAPGRPAFPPSPRSPGAPPGRCA